ncbi:MAG: M13 family metallopeptidase [Actinomycetales bacterium]
MTENANPRGSVSTPTPASPALDPATFDPSVRPQDDLFRHVHGPWLRETDIPADKPIIGAFRDLADEAEAAVRDIITSLPTESDDPDVAKVAALYASFMDTDAVEAAGSEPIAPLLARVDAVTSFAEFMQVSGELSRLGVGSLVDADAESDPGDPTRVLLFVGQSGLGLPDEAYYRDDAHADVREKYLAHLEATLRLIGADDAAGQAAAIMALETKIAACHWDRVRRRDMVAMYNLMPFSQVEESAPALELPRFFAAAGVNEAALAEVVNAQPSFFSDANGLAEEPLSAWQSWLRWQIVRSFSAYLSSAFVDASFAFYGTVLTGATEIRERWKRGVGFVEGSMGEAVGKIYVERHFSPLAKQRMDELVANLIEAYRSSISSLEWMTEPTKVKALDKLSKFKPKIGYPAVWRDYSALQVSPESLVANVMAVSEFATDWMLGKVGKPVDPDEWLMTPQTVNAYYHPLRNEIVFPAAILRPPFFNEHADDAVNYGGIGAVIGHEIGHGFDDQGSTCDGDGRLVNWWSDTDRAAFEERTSVLIDQFSTLEPRQTPGHQVNGELTIGENIGDLGGLGIAYKAWLLAGGADDDPADGLTPQQRLFLNWAMVWQTKARDEIVLTRLATDPHSPAEFRCNQIVRNIDEFYEAFEVTEGDELWLAPEQRVTIW